MAAYLYVETLKTGFASVAEFHCLHHDRDGRAYADPADNELIVEFGQALQAALR